jgi:hypothetical protein
MHRTSNTNQMPINRQVLVIQTLKGTGKSRQGASLCSKDQLDLGVNQRPVPPQTIAARESAGRIGVASGGPPGCQPCYPITGSRKGQSVRRKPRPRERCRPHSRFNRTEGRVNLNMVGTGRFELPTPRTPS